MISWRAGLAIFVLAGATGGNSLVGDWMTPGGSVIRVEGCGDAICMTVVKISPTAKGTHDANNPDKTLQTRAICDLTVGQGFHPRGEIAAEDGTIYDPESGKTYRAKMERKGDELKLRGFIGVSLFGRTETWKKVVAVETCRP